MKIDSADISFSHYILACRDQKQFTECLKIIIFLLREFFLKENILGHSFRIAIIAIKNKGLLSEEQTNNRTIYFSINSKWTLTKFYL